MKISDSKPTTPLAWSVARYAQIGEATAASPSRSIADTANILGIPDAELTVKVCSANMQLMEEVETLRRAT